MQALSRRNFLKGATAAAMVALPGGARTLDGSGQSLSVEQIDVAVQALPPALEGYRIAFISDLHLGSFVPQELIEEALDAASSSGARLLLLGGDFIGYRDSIRSRNGGGQQTERFDHIAPERLAEHLFSEVSLLLGRLTFEDGIYAVFGNHDRFLGSRRRTFLEQAGIEVLENRTAVIRNPEGASLQITGTDDYQYGRPRIGPMSVFPSEGTVRILLTHNPDLIADVLSQGKLHFDLCLAGHTHGGQIRLPLLGALEYNVENRLFTIGQSRVGATTVYVTRGVGMVNIPLRLNCPPEVSILSLQRA